MTAVLPARLMGAQTPRIGSWPQYRSTSGPEVVEHAAGAGVFLDPWQKLAVDVACAERENGDWSAWEYVLIVCRQNGKNEVITVLQLADLFLFDDVRTILHSAHEYYAAQVQFRRLTSIINNTPHLKKRVERMPQGSGEEAIWTRDGTHLKFIARKTTGTSGRSYTVDRLYFDEAFMLAASAVGGIMPALSAVRNPWIGYFSSSGMAYSTQLHALRKRGIAGDDELAYLEWSVEEGSDRTDRTNWAVANPALGIRITEAHVARELTSMPALEFDRERLGIWDAPLEEGDRVITDDAWAALADENSQLVGAVVMFAIDRSPDGITSIAVAGRRLDNRFHVEVVENRAGTSWVVDRVAELHKAWDPPAWVLDSASPAAGLIPALQEAGIPLELMGAAKVVSACASFVDAAEEDNLRHLDQAPLTLALANARKRPIGDGGWGWSRKKSDIDISPLVAATYARHGFAVHAADQSGSFMDCVK